MKFLAAGWIILSCVLTIHATSQPGPDNPEALPDETADYEEPPKCVYGGKTYYLGEEIPTDHLCLSCKCSEQFVEPNDRVCDVVQCVQTNYLELGCVPKYDDKKCCPVAWSCDEQLSAKCDQRYFKHYPVKRCIPKHDNGSECPTRFECPPLESLPKYEKECEFEGRLYKEGDNVDVHNPCERCQCRRSWDEKMDIICASVECFGDFRPLNESCYRTYEHGKCCSSGKKCEDPTKVEFKEEKTCEYGGKHYHLGQKIYPQEDPCLICICDENWTGIFGSSCHVHQCSLDRKRDKIIKGCLPIYHEKTCCPIEYYCGSPEEGFRNTTESLAQESDIEAKNTCVFQGVNYKLGQILDINHPTHCVTCKCSTPPDFTCIHRTCPHPPNDDYENCPPKYAPGECCPTYTCKKPSGPNDHACSPVQCPEGCQQMTVHNSCPFCQCNEILCAPPKCAPGCSFHTEEGKCPECQCPDFIKAALACAPVKCSPQCHEVIGSLGCPVCVCGPLCSMPQCSEGWHLNRDVGDGECPSCVFDGPEQQPEGNVLCSPVRCPPTCREVAGDMGCPSCVCDPLCSPPKCDTDCELDLSVLPPGKCPGCVCKDQGGQAPTKLCAPVKCGPLCHVAYDETDCPTCICDALCSPPFCDKGCSLEYDPDNGPCPTCICKADNLECPQVKCSPECHEGVGAYGCPTCFCGPVCSPPKCDSGCFLEYDHSSGPCPQCVCLQPRQNISHPTPMKACAPVKCEAECIEAMGNDGCTTCACNSQCLVHTCEAGLVLMYNPEKLGPCPTCQTHPNEPRIQCAIPRCDGDCVVDYSAEPCPSCTCGVSSGVQCSAPKCPANCFIDYSSIPCPSCVCNNTDGPTIHCSVPNCGPGCQVDYNAKPCPSCSCSNSFGGVQCSPPKCPEGCNINYNARPCPSCDCKDNEDVGQVQCSTPKCRPGCRINQNSEPCPTCVCPMHSVTKPRVPDILCSQPKCDPGCRINYNARPCPSCSCGGTDVGVTDILCSPPVCDEGCRVNYSTKPCPTCDCGSQTAAIKCSIPRCSIGCFVDYSSKPCPSCSCTGAATINVACSMPKCGLGCFIDASTKPCPSCYCPTKDIIQCAPVTCDHPCQMDHSTKPCPSCSCSGGALGNPQIQCSTPNCGPSCSVDYSTKPCPSCKCDGATSLDILKVQCAMPNCGVTCSVDYSTKPCPSCKCDGDGATVLDISKVQCAMPNCGPTCTVDYSAKPCPSCKCAGDAKPAIQCSPPNCEQGCTIVMGSEGCPTCDCSKPGFSCGVPMCGPGCRIDYNADPCPTCVCDKFYRRYATQQLNIFRDPYCNMLKCGPGCERAAAPSGPNERCPHCVCRGRSGEGVKCLAMHCNLPCQWKRYTEHGCPTCDCYALQGATGL